MKRSAIAIALLASPLLLGGCDQIQSKLGIEDPAAKAAKQEAEGKAVGGACRQSGRAIEDCYSVYSWLPKDSVYAGWREMDVYMRENQIETISPVLPPAPPPEDPAAKKKKKKKADGEAPKEGETAPAGEAPKEGEPPKEAAKH
jgi:hypothetical protein